MKRTQIKRYSWIKKISKKRSKQSRIYTKDRKQFLQDNPNCMVCNSNDATDIHHKKGRTGNNYLDTTTWASVCRACHNEIHSHPALSRKQGWIL